MTITPFQPGSISIPENATEDELYTWMDTKTHGLYEKAQQSVNEWWSAVVVALLAADQFYGWDTAQPNRGKTEQPKRLVSWCKANGLDTPNKVERARAIGKACLFSGFDVHDLVSELGPSKLRTIGTAGPVKAERLLEMALDGATVVELAAESRYLNNSPEVIQNRENELNRWIQEETKIIESSEVDSPAYKNAVSKRFKFRSQLNSRQREIHDGPVDDLKHLEERPKKTTSKLDAEKAREILTQLQALKEDLKQTKDRADKAEKAKADAVKAKNAVKQELEQKEAELRRANPFGSLSPMIRAGSIQHAVLEFQGAATELQELRLASPGDSTDELEVIAVDAMNAWVQVLSPSMLQELVSLINNKQQQQSVSTTKTINVTAA